ncbi:hypothetical protein SADUNF_Sadunf05G0169500 [Salix dunnii]|uniref:Uncharacterized protein n=1 Tax=Salix dunnii TaxID=1413687 RepID=A0A835K2F1_9ROSI|nr:hypothetical protein SADUNF_Sadunf05G0169500 [Salix dunnii]
MIPSQTRFVLDVNEKTEVATGAFGAILGLLFGSLVKNPQGSPKQMVVAMLNKTSIKLPSNGDLLIFSFDDFFPGIPGSNGIIGTVLALPIDIPWTILPSFLGVQILNLLCKTFNCYPISWSSDMPPTSVRMTRQLIDPNMYWFAIPNIGSVLKGLSQGRKELLSLLNRQRYKEMMLAPLEKKRLRLSLLDMRFHLRDLIGSGHLKIVNTPTGLLVQVSKD